MSNARVQVRADAHEREGASMREWEQAGQRDHHKWGGQRERGWGAAAVQQLQPHPPLFIYLVFSLSAAVSYSLPPPVLFKYCSVIVIVIVIVK